MGQGERPAKKDGGTTELQDASGGHGKYEKNPAMLLEPFFSPLQVRSPLMQWHEARRHMKADPRWELTRLLDREEKEQIFQDHVLELANKKRLQFRKLLEETPQV